ncbi:MAG TPA: glycosyltransferase [Candidatus Tectomicrobia bacterium]|nr:glycosyltransferase [Candidatus Tectomicrobia bacterium]
MQFHILSFEGPDAYSRAGGIASRVTGLVRALADAGYETHLWFVGDPALPGHETQGNLHLHRWCQWISQHHPAGVYDGEEGKRADFVASLPPYILGQVLLPYVQHGGQAVVLAEEWHTVEAVLYLNWLLCQAQARERVTILWNANNTFSFHRIDWRQLTEAAIITTVSRYMKHLMQRLGVDPLVIPNGLATEALISPERRTVAAFRASLRHRTVLCKVARWDPDKRWLLAIQIVGALKQRGWRPLLIARGGIEAHGHEVLAAASSGGLRVTERALPEPDVRGLIQAMEGLRDYDIVNLSSPLQADTQRVLFQGAAAVLANSGHEPYGLVGLETMAVGGVACTGCSGEDYAVPGYNALVLETEDPGEFVGLFTALRANPVLERAIRRAGCATAKHYVWPHIIQRILLPRLSLFAPQTNVLTGEPAQGTHTYISSLRQRRPLARDVLKWIRQGADTLTRGQDEPGQAYVTLAKAKNRRRRGDEAGRKLLVG